MTQRTSQVGTVPQSMPSDARSRWMLVFCGRDRQRLPGICRDFHDAHGMEALVSVPDNFRLCVSIPIVFSHGTLVKVATVAWMSVCLLWSAHSVKPLGQTPLSSFGSGIPDACNTETSTRCPALQCPFTEHTKISLVPFAVLGISYLVEYMSGAANCTRAISTKHDVSSQYHSV